MDSKRIRNTTVIKTSHDAKMAGLLATWASFPRHGAVRIFSCKPCPQSPVCLNCLFHSIFRLANKRTNWIQLANVLESTSISPNYCLLNGRWNWWFIFPQWWTSRDTFGRSFHHLGSCISTLRVGQMPLHPMRALVLKLWNKWISATEQLMFFIFLLKGRIVYTFSSKKLPPKKSQPSVSVRLSWPISASASTRRRHCCVPWMRWRRMASGCWRLLVSVLMLKPCTATWDGSKSSLVNHCRKCWWKCLQTS